nr:hypothetical protein [uncultured Acinetobacter sp.]
MRDKEYSEWMGTLGFGVLRHANCCKIAFNGGWESRQTEVDELQKRVDAIKQLIQVYKEEEKELELKEWEQSTIYGRVAIELEQALKGEQYEEHRKKAEDAISNGASLTNHRIEL